MPGCVRDYRARWPSTNTLFVVTPSGVIRREDRALRRYYKRRDENPEFVEPIVKYCCRARGEMLTGGEYLRMGCLSSAEC